MTYRRPSAHLLSNPVAWADMRAMSARSQGLRRLWYAVLILLAVVAGVIATVGGSSTSAPSASHATPARAAMPGHDPAPASPSARAPTGGVPVASRQEAARLLGQMIVARFSGPEPSRAFLTRIRRGQIGGVILFGDNVSGGLAATRRLTHRLQHAAAAGRNPPLLIMTDQEGGDVKRLPGPPSLAPADMNSPRVARAQGKAAGRLLRSVGVNVDLAPVADVEARPNFLGSRSFGRSPSRVARLACAFAAGLASENVAYTLKHFPGLGLATGNTDLGSVSVNASAATLRSDYRAYQRCGAGSLGLVMLSSASYPALAVHRPAVMSRKVYRHELRLAVPSGSPVTISDDLQSPAIESQSSPARHSIQAGLDLLLYAQTEQASAAAYSKLLSELRSGSIATRRVATADQAIAALKSRLGH